MEVKKVAVITGDLINSRQIPIEKRQQVYDYMARIYHSFAIRRGWHDTAKLEFFRGDSFQLLVDEPEVALRVALFLRARLRSVYGRNDMQDGPNLSKYERKSNSKKLWDARIAIGIGEVSYLSESVLNSDGVAFILSGHTLDQMKYNEQLAIKIQGVEESSMIQSQLDLLLRLGGGIVQDWTEAQSELAAECIEYPNKTQLELEKEYGIPQTTISRRKSGGHIDEILNLCDYFEKLIPTLL
jgi:hypothetical protein